MQRAPAKASAFFLAEGRTRLRFRSLQDQYTLWILLEDSDYAHKVFESPPSSPQLDSSPQKENPPSADSFLRRGGDSNSRYLSACRFSKPVVSTTHAPLQGLELKHPSISGFKNVGYLGAKRTERSHRLTVRTPAFHAGNRGSIPRGITSAYRLRAVFALGTGTVLKKKDLAVLPGPQDRFSDATLPYRVSAHISPPSWCEGL